MELVFELWGQLSTSSSPGRFSFRVSLSTFGATATAAAAASAAASAPLRVARLRPLRVQTAVDDRTTARVQPYSRSPAFWVNIIMR